MKHLKYYIKKIFLFYLFVVLITSCFPEPIENFKGGIICEKESPPAGMRFEVKYKDLIDLNYYYKTVYVLEYDFNKYNVGDTIK